MLVLTHRGWIMNESLQLLFDQGGSVLRYLVPAEFGFPQAADLEQLRREMLASTEVQKWLGNLSASAQAGIRPNTIHGCADTCYENAMGKLIQYGMRAGMPELDARTEPFRRWLAEFPGGAKYLFGSFYSTLVASMLAMAGYRDDAVIRVLHDRLEWTYDFCRQGRYDIYADKAGFRGIPKVWTDVPLIDPSLYPEEELRLPLVHDFNGYAAVFAGLADGRIQEMLDTLAQYVMDPRYQALREGYGIVTNGKRRYWAMGWSVHLPGYPGAAPRPSYLGLIGRLATMSAFPVARNHQWYSSSLEYLESFRTPHGTYLFPRELLPEKKASPWVMGTHTGQGENRRRASWQELESTYWMERLRRR